MRPLWHGAVGAPDLAARQRIVAQLAQALRTLGPANFLYADGDALFAHGHRRTQAGGDVRPPGLHLLCRACKGERANCDAHGLQIVPHEVGGSQLLVKSVPLTADAAWRPLGEGELIVACAGRPLD